MVPVMIEAHVAPASEARLLAATRERLDFPKGRLPGRRWSRVFQGLGDPTAFLFLAHWDSREGFVRAYGGRSPHQAEALLARPVEPHYFQSLVAFERVMVPVVARSVLVIDGPPTAMPLLPPYPLDLFQTHPGALPRPGPRIVGEETSPTAILLLVTGWQTAAGLDAVRDVMTVDFTARIAGAGATLHHYLGLPTVGV